MLDATTSNLAVDPTGYWEGDGLRQLAVLEDGTYFWLTAGVVLDEGTWTTGLDRIVFTSNSNSTSCANLAVGSYGYNVSDEGALRLTFSTDDCDDERRIAPLAGQRSLDRTDPFELPQPASPEEAAWDALPILNGPTGTLVRLPRLNPGLAFESPGSLSVGQERPTDDFITLFTDPDGEPAMTFIRLEGTSVDDQVARFSDMPEFTESAAELEESVGFASRFDPKPR